MMKKETLYKIDTKGKVRVWWMEYDHEKFRAHSGLQDGKIVTSGWQYPEEKNVGKANATTTEEQVLAEVTAKYEARMYQGKYHPSIEEAKKGAKFIECMLADKYDAKKHNQFPYWSQPKLDGVRCLVSEEGMQTRNGKEFVSAPHIYAQLESFLEQFPDYILDGELYNHALKDEFEKIISLARKTKPTAEDLQESKEKVEFHIYDVITPEPMVFEERMKFLQENVAEVPGIVLVATNTVNSKDEVEEQLGKYLEEGYEGQMLRCTKTPYEHKRSKSLVKHKVFEDDEFVIVDIIEGKGNWAGYAKAVTILLPDGTTQNAGMRGNFSDGKTLLKNKEEYLTTEVTVRYQNKTGDGKLRFPVVTAFWKGKRDI